MAAATQRVRTSPLGRTAGLGRFLWAALLLHGAALALTALGGAPAPQRVTYSSTAQPAAALLWLEIAAQPAASGAEPSAREPNAAAPALGARPAALGPQAAAASAPALVARSARQSSEPRPAPSGPGPQEADASAGAGEPSALLERSEGAGAGRRLSLEQLGVGTDSNPFIGPSNAPADPGRLGERLQQSLRADLARRDQRRGLGPEGPVVAALEPLVLDSASAPNTSALLRVRADAAGRVTGVDVLESDGESDEWRRIAERLLAALGSKALRVPSGSAGLNLDLRVASRVQLPSGTDPGLSVKAFGYEVKKGGGPRSTQLTLLTPMIQHVTVPGTNETLPVPSLALLGGAGDLADIGATARRVVRAHLVALEVLPGDALHTLPASGPRPALPR